MIWFSARIRLDVDQARAPRGPISMPTIRNTATSGIRIFCASRPVTVPIARMSPQDSRVCLAISIEAEVPRECLRSGIRAYFNAFSQAPISLAATLACCSSLPMVKKPWNWPGKCTIGHGNAGLLQPCGIFVAFVAQRIGAGGEHIGRRQTGECLGARRRSAPVAARRRRR